MNRKVIYPKIKFGAGIFLLTFSAYSDGDVLASYPGGVWPVGYDTDGDIGYAYSTDDGTTFSKALLGFPYSNTDTSNQTYVEYQSETINMGTQWAITFTSNDPAVTATTNVQNFILRLANFELGVPSAATQPTGPGFTELNCAQLFLSSSFS